MEKATSPVINKKKDDKKTLDFNQAIVKVIEGKKIHKLEWEDKEYYAFLLDDILLLHKPDKKDYQWVLSRGDLEGTDYITLQEKI